MIDEKKIRKEALENTIFDKFLLYLSSVFFLAMFLIIIFQVFMRYFRIRTIIDIPYFWTEEIARYVLVLTTFLGSAVAMRKEEHIRITALNRLFNPKLKAIIDFIENIITISVVSFLIIGFWNMGARTIRTPIGTLSWIKVGYIYYALMTISIFFFIYSVRWSIVRGKELHHFIIKKREDK